MIPSLKASVMALACLFAAAGLRAEEKKVDFVKDVLPIIKQNCIDCHSPHPGKKHPKPAAELSLADKKSAMKGGRSGAAIVPGKAEDSLLFKLLHGPVPRPVKGEDDKDIAAMPKPEKKGEKWKSLSDGDIATIKAWIDQGADWPAKAKVKKN